MVKKVMLIITTMITIIMMITMTIIIKNIVVVLIVVKKIAAVAWFSLFFVYGKIVLAHEYANSLQNAFCDDNIFEYITYTDKIV